MRWRVGARSPGICNSRSKCYLIGEWPRPGVLGFAYPLGRNGVLPVFFCGVPGVLRALRHVAAEQIDQAFHDFRVLAGQVGCLADVLQKVEELQQRVAILLAFLNAAFGFGLLHPPDPGHRQSFHLPERIANEPLIE